VTRPAHQEADGQIREWGEDFDVMGEKLPAPSVGGSASNVCNCRCQLLKRPRWALDDEELQVLKDRAGFYGLDKTKSFEEYKEKFLKLPPVPVQVQVVQAVQNKVSPDSFRKEIKQINKDIDDLQGQILDARQSLYNIKYGRVKTGSLTEDEVNKRIDEFTARIKELESLRVDKVRSLATCMNTTFTLQNPSEDFISMLVNLETSAVEYKEVMKRTSDISDIVSVLAGGDATSGSCASLGLAYIGQKQGYDILDFRGGSSLSFFHTTWHLSKISQLPNVKTFNADGKSSVTIGNNLLKMCQVGKEYYLCVGEHASIVRKTQEGKLQYLELQSRNRSGWTDFDKNPRSTLSDRFGCSSRSNPYRMKELDFMMDIDSDFFASDEFRTLLGYINTDPDKQKKGRHGGIK
jgi:hypothetical protein